MLSKSEQECFQHWLLFGHLVLLFIVLYFFSIFIFFNLIIFWQIQQFCNLYLFLKLFFCLFPFVLKCSENIYYYLFSHIFQFSCEYIQNTMCCWHGKLHSWLFPQLQINFVDQHGRNHSCSLNIPAAGCKETMWMNTLLLRFRLSQVHQNHTETAFHFFQKINVSVESYDTSVITSVDVDW